MFRFNVSLSRRRPSTCVHSDNQIRTDPVCYGFAEDIRKWTLPAKLTANQSADWPYRRVYVGF